MEGIWMAGLALPAMTGCRASTLGAPVVVVARVEISPLEGWIQVGPPGLHSVKPTVSGLPAEGRRWGRLPDLPCISGGRS